MSITIAASGLWVHDQDVAVDFWTNKVGFEIRADWTIPEMGNFRWVTVGPKDQPDFEISLLAVPGPPMVSAEQSELITTAMASGFHGGIFLVTDDVYAEYDRLAAAGVEMVEKPEQRPYGIDCGFRDPSGNQFRLMQPLPQ
ncbi:MAG: VOC family protein [Nocardioidaceae bacterium]|nr:MAG: VOC family protein [Nocardioidaceae bacterium]